MISKISFSKMVKSELRRKIWLICLLALGFFLVMPVGGMLRVDALQNMLEEHMITVQDMIARSARYGDPSNYVVGIGVAVSAVMAAFACYAYVHSSRKLDLFHSLPISKSRMFGVQYVTGCLIFLIPYAVNVLLLLVVYMVKTVCTGQVFLSLLIGILFQCLYFLLYYNVTIIAIMLTGRLLVSGLALAVFVGYFPILNLVRVQYAQLCFQTYYHDADSFWDRMLNRLSPVGMHLLQSSGYAGEEKQSVQVFLEQWPDTLTAAAAVALTLAAAVWLYRKRSSESAGRSIAFFRIKPVVKILVTSLLSVGGGLFFVGMAGKETLSWLLFGVVFTGLVVHGFIEVIYAYEFRKVLSGWITLAVSVGGVLIFTLLCWFDVFQFDTYLPEKDELEAIAVSVDDLDYGTYFWGNSEYGEGGTYRLNRGLMKDTTAGYQLAKIGVENQEIDEAVLSKKQDVVSYAAVRYQLTDGSSKYRRYQLTGEQLEQVMGPLYDTEGFKEGQFPILEMDVNTMDVGSAVMTDAYHESEELDLTAKQSRKLIKALQKDEKALSGSQRTAEKMMGTLSFYALDYRPLTGDYTIYEGMKTVRRVLEQYGYPMSRVPNLYEISSIQVNYYREELMEEAEDHTVVFTKREEIQEILNSLVRYDAPAFMVNQECDAILNIGYEGAKGSVQNSIGYSLKRGKLPDCVQKGEKELLEKYH